MIQPAEKEIIVSALGKQYSPLVLEDLKKRNLHVNPNTGNEYDNKYINRIVNGDFTNRTVENAIIELAVRVKKQKSKEQAKRLKKLLS